MQKMIEWGWQYFAAAKTVTFLLFVLLIVSFARKNTARAGFYASLAIFSFLALYTGGSLYVFIKEMFL
jgi:hypothetical protein